MNIGIVELVLVFGVVLALAVIDLMATPRGVTSMTAAPEAKARSQADHTQTANQAALPQATHQRELESKQGEAHRHGISRRSLLWNCSSCSLSALVG